MSYLVIIRWGHGKIMSPTRFGNLEAKLMHFSSSISGSFLHISLK